MQLGEVLRRAAGYLEQKGVENPRLDAEHLLAHALGLTRLELYLQHDRPLTQGERARARALVERRGRREPLAYVLGEWGFRRLVLKTDARALVPRPETEIVVEACLEHLEGLDSPAVLDVGTGTGAIALAIADEHPGARVTALDRSEAALSLARENTDAAGLHVTLVHGDAAAGLPGGPYDLVVSNPPYVPEEEVEGLAPEVREYEPREAILDAGQGEAVCAGARAVLSAGGWLVLETYRDAAAATAALCASLGYAETTIRRDLVGHERVVEARWEPSRTR